MSPPNAYAQWFRDSTPYIRAHRGRTVVVMLGADALTSRNLVNTVHDLALLHVLGMRLVVVHGADGLGDEPLSEALWERIERSAWAARSRLEALFTTGIPQSALRNRHISLVGGNLVVAQPAGVVGGVDQMRAGRPRHVHADVMHALLDAGNVVLVSPLGYSATGAVYAMEAEQLAATVAGELRADKLVIYDANAQIAGHGDLTTRQLAALRAEQRAASLPAANRLDALADACQRGVARAHLVGFGEDGVLLRELFTAQGAGTQVSDGDYRLVRRAAAADVSAIVEMIRPLEDANALVRRPRSRIERDIECFFVAELDGALTGCCALLPLGSGVAELACLVGGHGIGTRLLAAVEAAARDQGVERLLALTTQAADWFVERGFAAGRVADLPVSRKALYNYARNSQVFIKDLAP